MKILYMECLAGAAGDMITSALYELLDEKGKREYLDKINSAGLEGVRVEAEKKLSCGITGTHMHVYVNGEEEHQHNEHAREHEHHHHRSLSDIFGIIDGLVLDDDVIADVKSVYNVIASAEGKVHGQPAGEIHFHEVGTLDAIADIASAVMILKMLGVEKVITSGICTGYGHVHAAHGILPVPAPATAVILEGIPVFPGDVEGEMCTPTGAAVLRHITDEFGEMPPMKLSKTGYGMGTKDTGRLNAVRAFIGELTACDDRIVSLTCNIDDMSGEAIGYACERLAEKGSLDVFTQPIFMKKNRPAVMLTVLAKSSDADRMAELMFRYTSTIGIRKTDYERYKLERTVISSETDEGIIRRKDVTGYGTGRGKYEYDDVAKVARKYDISYEAALEKIEGDE